MDKLELQKLRDLPIEGVAERLGLRVTRGHKCLCPFHDDHHASLSFNIRKNNYRCFVCGEHGGTIDLTMKTLGVGFKEACQWLAKDASLPLIGEDSRMAITDYKSPPLVEVGRGQFDASRYVRFFEHPWLSDEARHFLYDERKLDPRVINWCRVSSWRDRNGIPWLQIPYYNIEGELIGVQNRRLSPLPTSPRGGEDSSIQTSPRDLPEASPRGGLEGAVGLEGSSPRFRFPYGSRCSIYNLPVIKRLKQGDELWITEGCSDCWAMLSAGHKAIAIPSATLLSPKDKELLASLTTPSPSGEGWGEGLITFHMYPDKDAPGERLFLQLKDILPDLVHHQLPPGCKDFSDYYLLQRQ